MAIQNLSILVLLTLATLISLNTLVRGEDDLDKLLSSCKMELTSGYGYSISFRVETAAIHSEADDGALVFHFFVKTKSDAHILLSSRQSVKAGDALYEIVIGANRNSNSVIRRIRQGSTRAAVATSRILSGNEARGFWIRYNKNTGLLEVGKRNFSAPFIFYRDPNPIEIRYIALSSWTDIFAFWFYDCPFNNQEQNEATKVNRPKSQSALLRSSILQDYDPYAVPETEDGNPLTVYADLSLNHIALNERLGILSLHGVIHFHWAEDKIKWNTSDFGNLSSIRLGERDLWIPEFYLFNSISHSSDPFNSAPMLITSEGIVLWAPTIEFETRCDVDVSEWPSDSQKCPIIFGFWSQADKLRLQFYKNNETYWTEMHTATEWKLDELSTGTVNVNSSPWTDLDDEPHVASQINLKLSRSQRSYRVVLYSPLIITCLLGMLSFWMSPRESTRILIPCLDLFILSTLVLIVNNTIPAGTSHTPKLLRVYELNLLGALFAMVIGIITVRLTRFSPKIEPFTFLYRILHHKAIQISLQLPQLKGGAYNHLEDESRLSGSSSTVGADCGKLSDEEIQQFWKLIATAVDRVAFIVYTLFIAIGCSQL